MKMDMHIRGSGGGLNAEVLELSDGNAVLYPRPDPGGGVQWFHFLVEGQAQRRSFTVSGLDSSFFPDAFRHGEVAMQRGDGSWRLLKGHWDGAQLVFVDEMGLGRAFAAWAAYPPARVALCVARAIREGWTARLLCRDEDGLPIWALCAPTVEARARRSIVCIAAQHPGERVALWTAEAFLRRWLCEARRDALPPLWLVLSANPGGLARGHARKDGAGRDLNRRWHIAEASSVTSALSSLIAGASPALVLDLHGDEVSRDAYVVGPVVYEVGGAAIDAASHFAELWSASCPFAGPRPEGDHEGDDDPGISVNALAAAFGVAGVMVELPHLVGRAPTSVRDPYAWIADESAGALVASIRAFTRGRSP